MSAGERDDGIGKYRLSVCQERERKSIPMYQA
jgi:hypothetical protein